MKNNFRIFSILLIIALMLSAVIIPTSAALAPYVYGDLDHDYSVDIDDVTILQRCIAKIEKLNVHFMAADVDGDEKITVFDATIIQKYLAQIETPYPIDESFDINRAFYGVIVDYDSDSAMVGYPVTFSVNGYTNPGPTTAKLYINEELVAQTQEQNEETGRYDLTYTFEKTGAYRVKVILSDKWESYDGNHLDPWTTLYVVKEAPTDTTTPIITSISRNNKHNTPTIYVHADFGTKPYQYKYTLTDDTHHGEIIYHTDFIDSNVLNLYKEFSADTALETYNAYTIEVEVKDANGKIAKDKYTFRIEGFFD